MPPILRLSPHPPATETLLRSCMLVLWFMMGVAIYGAPPSPTETVMPLERTAAIALYLGFGVALWFNTRHIAPHALERASMALLAFQAACGFTLHTDLLYLVAAQIPLALPGRAALTWIVCQTALLFVWILLLDSLGAPLQFMQLPQLPHLAVILMTDLGVFAGHGFAFFMGYLAASEARGRRAAERINAELEATREMLAQNTRAAERNYIARELHDTLGHHLVALKVNLELAQHLAQAPNSTALSDSFDLVCRLLADVRAVVGQVRSAPNVDLRGALHTLLAGISECTVHLDFPEALDIRDPGLCHILFRCVQEGVTNTLKHSGARGVWVSFGAQQEDLVVTVRDDGRGCDTPDDGNGLTGMRERLAMAGGSLEIATGAGRGFTLTAQLPGAIRRVDSARMRPEADAGGAA